MTFLELYFICGLAMMIAFDAMMEPSEHAKKSLKADPVSFYLGYLIAAPLSILFWPYVFRRVFVGGKK